MMDSAAIRTRIFGLLAMSLTFVLAGQCFAEQPAPPPTKDSASTTGAGSAGLFEKRILPIFKSPKASSCTECHLSSVELRDYIQPTQEKTFAALVRGGLVDVKNPDKSKILEFISRKPEKPSLITDKIRQEEFEAFRSWLRAAVVDPELLAAKASSDAPATNVPVEVIRHTRKDRVLGSFVENVWSEMQRCVHCHSPEFNQKLAERQGKEYAEGISWIVPNDPAATMKRLGESELLNYKNPEKSLLLTKPTLQEKHKGGIKMLVGDRTYKQFLTFIEDYAAIALKQYSEAKQLPKPNPEVAIPSSIILRINEIPARFDKMPLHVELYRWNDGEKKWSTDRWATAEWKVVGKASFWQFKLHLTAPRESARAKELSKLELPAGQYLVKIFLDQRQNERKGSRAEWPKESFVGQVEVRSEWKPEPANMTVIRYPKK